jgi:chromosome segregation ATPase
MGVSKPVKVSAALYEQLKQRAVKQDITIQETLKSTLDASRATIEQLNREQQRLKRSLEEEENKLAAQTKEGQATHRDLLAKGEEINSLRFELDSVQEEHDCLSGTTEGLRIQLQQLGEEKEEASESAEQYKKQFRGAVFVLGILTMMTALWLLWDRSQKRKENKDQPGRKQPPVTTTLRPWG